MALGVSSLGRLEPQVLSSVDAVSRMLTSWSAATAAMDAPGADFDWGDRLLREQTERLLGPPPNDRSVRIMVTVPIEAADDYQPICDLLRAGTNCLRINCAHGTRAEWLRIVEHVRRAEISLHTTCKVLIDLAGAKLRTGPVAPGPAVVKVRPTREPDNIGVIDDEGPPARDHAQNRDPPRIRTSARNVDRGEGDADVGGHDCSR